MSRLLEEIQWRGDLLLAGRYDDLARFYATPLPIHFGRSRILIDSHDALRDYFQCFHTVLARNGVHRLLARQRAQELPRNGRFRLWITWECPDQNARAPSLNTVYFCNSEAGETQVEMIAYTHLFMPELLPMWNGMRKTA